MNTLLIISYTFLFLLIILLAVRDGVINKMFNGYASGEDPKVLNHWQDLFHLLGGSIRFLLIVLLIPHWKFILIAFNVSWTLYDLVLNLVKGNFPFYVGTTAKTDRILGRYSFWLKGVLLLVTIAVFIYF